jgi:hypothetical protein
MVGQCLNDTCSKLISQWRLVPFRFGATVLYFCNIFNFIFEYGDSGFSHKIYIIILKTN